MFLICLIVVALILTPVIGSAADAVEFSRDVQPVLTKLGCNSGACHGSLQGRGGMSLSLLGYDPQADYESLFLTGRGRRALAGSPDESLILQKASGRVAHGGGVRCHPDTEAYRLLSQYIAQGRLRPAATDPLLVALHVHPQQLRLRVGETATLRVTAEWADGETRDVTRWALFDSQNSQTVEISHDGVVTSQRPGLSAATARFSGLVAAVPVTIPYDVAVPPMAFEPRNRIDQLAMDKWQELGVVPARSATDTEFLRRVSLDLAGVLPTPEEVTTFLQDTTVDKRARAIDRLLERPEYVDLWTLRWSDLLRVHPRYLSDKGVASFRGWIRQSIRDNKPLDQWVRELLVAQGNLFTSGPVAFYFVDEKPEELAETTAQVFLGVRLQCTRCHHHPNEVWSQDDYYGLAAFFTRLEKKDTLDQGRFGGARAIRPVSRAMPNRQLTIPSKPKHLGEAQPLDTLAVDDIRLDLANWITARENPYFARNFANRYWGWMFGRGLIEPVDDVRATNPPSHPELLADLEHEFRQSGYNSKELLRRIANSAVYQLAAELTPSRDRDGMLLTHRVPRRLSAEVLLDAINQACGINEVFTGLPESTRAAELPDPATASHFLTTFGRPQRNSPCDCARSSQPDLSQALLLLNNPTLHGKLSHPEGRLARLLNDNTPDEEFLNDLYLATLARLPAIEERQTVQEALAGSSVRAEVWQDVLWTLINTPEFAFQH